MKQYPPGRCPKHLATRFAAHRGRAAPHLQPSRECPSRYSLADLAALPCVVLVLRRKTITWTPSTCQYKKCREVRTQQCLPQPTREKLQTRARALLGRKES